MIIDKLKTADGISLLKRLPENYAEQLSLNVPDHLNKLVSDVIRLLLTKINVPKDEIDKITEKIDRRRYQEMFALIEEYDVQETRRVARYEGKLEGKIEGIEEGKLKGKLEGKLEGIKEGKLEDAINIIAEFNATITKALEVTKLSEEYRSKLMHELDCRKIPYTQ